MEAKELGAFIAQIRKENQMTQAQLAACLKVTDKAVSRWGEGNGISGYPDTRTFGRGTGRYFDRADGNVRRCSSRR